MYEGRFVLPQLMDFFPKREFQQCVDRYRGGYRLRAFSCRDQFLAMLFAQLTHRDSLRDVVTCLDAMSEKLHHVGFRCRVARSTLARANEVRDWRIYHDFAQVLIRRARALYAGDPLDVDLRHTVYALDSTLIELCLTLFPWAHAQRAKAAIKLHTLLDVRGAIPCVIRISSAKMADSAMLDLLRPEPGALCLMDRGYNDFGRLQAWDLAGVFFVVRCRKNIGFARRAARAVDRATGLRSDQTVVFRDKRMKKKYPAPLRRVTFYDAEHRRRLILATNAFHLPALSIPQLYKLRWRVELFFKWIKQHLRIKHFFGHSPNAVKTQVWIAISTYLLVAIVKRELKIDRSLNDILQILSIALFEKTADLRGFLQQTVPLSTPPERNQLLLFDF